MVPVEGRVLHGGERSIGCIPRRPVEFGRKGIEDQSRIRRPEDRKGIMEEGQGLKGNRLGASTKLGKA